MKNKITSILIVLILFGFIIPVSAQLIPIPRSIKIGNIAQGINYDLPSESFGKSYLTFTLYVKNVNLDNGLMMSVSYPSTANYVIKSVLLETNSLNIKTPAILESGKDYIITIHSNVPKSDNRYVSYSFSYSIPTIDPTLFNQVDYPFPWLGQHSQASFRWGANFIYPGIESVENSTQSNPLDYELYVPLISRNASFTDLVYPYDGSTSSTTLSGSINDVVNGEVYYLKIGMIKNGAVDITRRVAISTHLDPPSSLNISKQSNGSIKVKWPTNSFADHYMIEVSESPIDPMNPGTNKHEVFFGYTGNNHVILQNLTLCKDYYIGVRAYRDHRSESDPSGSTILTTTDFYNSILPIIPNGNYQNKTLNVSWTGYECASSYGISIHFYRDRDCMSSWYSIAFLSKNTSSTSTSFDLNRYSDIGLIKCRINAYTPEGTIVGNWKTLYEAMCITDMRMTTVSENDIDTNIECTIYPNPTDQYIFVHENDFDNMNSNYQIIDQSGKTVQIGEMKIGNKIDVSKLNKGIYYISYAIENEQKVRRFIKSK